MKRYSNKHLVSPGSEHKLEVEGETFVLKRLSFGDTCRINSQSVSVEMDEQNRPKPKMDLGQYDRLSLLAALKSWTLKDNSTNEAIPLNEKTVGLLTDDTGRKLLAAARGEEKKEEEALKN